jgi:hypothetical protein
MLRSVDFTANSPGTVIFGGDKGHKEYSYGGFRACKFGVLCYGRCAMGTVGIVEFVTERPGTVGGRAVLT